MKKVVLLIGLLFWGKVETVKAPYDWGQIGHRAVGHIAEGLLTKKAQRNVKRVLSHESLADVSNWMDEIRSDKNFDYTITWHYCPIPKGMTYETITKQKGGDVIWALEKVIAELKGNKLNAEQEAVNLKFLTHMIGDIHQPLHIGNEADRGGTDIKVQWFGESTNLHSVWDNKLIEAKQLSSFEFAKMVNHPTREQIKLWQSASVRDWAMESMSYRDQVYELPESGQIGHEYLYRNFNVIELRIVQAGVRLAGIINDIYK